MLAPTESRGTHRAMTTKRNTKSPGTVTIILDPSQLKRMHAIADREDRSLSSLLRRLVADYLAAHAEME